MILYKNIGIKTEIQCCLAFASLAVLYIFWPKGITFDYQWFSHDFSLVNSEGSSHLDFTIDYFTIYMGTVIATYGWMGRYSYRIPKDIPGKVIVYMLYLCAWKEIIDLVFWYNENVTLIWELVIYSGIIFLLVPYKANKWMLKDVKSDIVDFKKDGVYKLYLFPTSKMLFIVSLIGLGVSGFKTLIIYNRQLFICGYQRNRYKVIIPKKQALLKLLRYCIVRQEKGISDIEDFIHDHNNIKSVWNPVSQTCLQVQKEPYEKRGIKFHSRIPSIDLLISENSKKP